jgi:hypothetical protein
VEHGFTFDLSSHSDIELGAKSGAGAAAVPPPSPEIELGPAPAQAVLSEEATLRISPIQFDTPAPKAPEASGPWAAFAEPKPTAAKALTPEEIAFALPVEPGAPEAAPEPVEQAPEPAPEPAAKSPFSFDLDGILPAAQPSTEPEPAAAPVQEPSFSPDATIRLDVPISFQIQGKAANLAEETPRPSVLEPSFESEPEPAPAPEPAAAPAPETKQPSAPQGFDPDATIRLFSPDKPS